MKQTTVRGIDPALARRLREEARRRGLSLNRTLVLLLRQATGLAQPPEAKKPTDRYADLDHLAGTWSAEEAEAFERASEAFERVDQEMWR
jgi:hypothetical protein